MSQREQVAITSRVFCLAAVLGLTLVGHNSSLIQTVVTVITVGALSGYVSYITGHTSLVVLTAETVIVGLIMGLTFPDSIVLMPYLVVLPLLAGLFKGFPGVVVNLLAQAAAVILIPMLTQGFSGLDQRALALLMAEAGWVEVEWLNLTFGVVALHRAIKPTD